MKPRLGIPVVSFLLVTFPIAAAAQSQTLQTRAVAESRTPGLAAAVAKRNAFNDAVLRLSQAPEIQKIQIQKNQLEALLPPLLSDASGKLDIPKIARGLYLFLRDPNAYADLMDARKQTVALDQELTKSRSEAEQRVLLNRLVVNQLIVQVYGDLARTEESPASVRVATPKGVQRSVMLAERAVTLGGDTPQALLALGDALIPSNQTAAAEMEYRQALRMDPASASAHIKLSEALRLQEKLPEAIAELREALSIEPRSAMAHTDLGFILAAQQNNNGAIAEYREALKYDSDYSDAHNYLAISLARQGKLPEAVDEFREMVRIDPDSALGYYNMAIALADMERDAEASEALRQVLRINPNHYNAHFNIGEMLRLEGKLDESVKQFKAYLRLAPNNTPAAQRNIQRATEFVRTHDDP